MTSEGMNGDVPVKSADDLLPGEMNVPKRSEDEAFLVEQLRVRLSGIRSSIGHIERKITQEIDVETLNRAMTAAMVAEEAAFKVRFIVGYP